MAENFIEIEDDEQDEKEFVATYNLSSYGIDFDVSGLVRRMNAGSIYLPDFQRNYVWNEANASRFIESLLLGLPIPSVCLHKEEDNKQIIIDGFQRLETIRSFYRKEFPNGKKFKLCGVNPLYNDKFIDELDEESRLKLDDTLIHATVVKADDPQEKNYNAVYLIFERLNTGGVKLTPQEIRACIYHGPFQEILKKLSENEIYSNYFRISDKRKKDQEIILRLLSLCCNYKNYFGNMKQFLNDFMNTNKTKTEKDLSDVINIFEKSLKIISTLDDKTFKPNGILSLAILDAVFVGTYNKLSKSPINDNKSYKEKINELINNQVFLRNIETGKTHHTNPLKERIDLAISYINEAK